MFSGCASQAQPLTLLPLFDRGCEAQLENQTDGGKLQRQMLKNSLLFFADVASLNILIIHSRCDCQSHCKNKSTTKAFISPPPRATDIKHESVQEK